MQNSPQDYLPLVGDPGMVGKTAQVQDYLPLVGDPGEVGKTAQEKPTMGALLLVLFILLSFQSKL